MTDNYAYHTPGLESVAIRHVQVTPSDDADISPIPRALLIVDSGDVAIRDEAGTDITYTAVPAYTTLPIRAVRVLQTGTTATNIVGWD